MTQIDKVTNAKNSNKAKIKIYVPNARLQAAIEEGERIANDPNVKAYHSMKELREALEEN